MRRSILGCILVSIFSLNALRDPFTPAEGCNTFAYTAFGTVHNTTSHFGVLSIDGACYYVKEGQELAGHIIVQVSEHAIILKDRRGKELKILKQEKALQLR